MPPQVAKPARPSKPVTKTTSASTLVREALSAGEGVVRLAPCWVPRSFLMPGGRLKLDPRLHAEVEAAMYSLLRFHLERDLKSWSFLDTVRS